MQKILLILLLTFTMIVSGGCLNENKNVYIKSAEKYEYFHAFGVAYGMPYDECKAILSNDKIEFTERKNDDGFTTLSFKNKLYDIPCEVHLFVMTNPDYPIDAGLYMIKVQLEDEVDYNETLMKLYNEIDNKKVPYKISSSGESDIGIKHSSFDNISSIQTIQDSNVAIRDNNVVVNRRRKRIINNFFRW